jgi:hypothetical protein
MKPAVVALQAGENGKYQLMMDPALKNQVTMN